MSKDINLEAKELEAKRELLVAKSERLYQEVDKVRKAIGVIDQKLDPIYKKIFKK